MTKPRIECCFSPALLHLYTIPDTIVVIIDIFRATSTIAAALDNGASKIIPVDDVNECIEIGMRTKNSITAGERNGQIAEGLSYGNSPSAYHRDFVQGKTLVLTTTNGTRLLYQVQNAAEILSGSFLNLDATADYIKSQNKNVLLACASWKDRFNLEDCLFAGALYNELKKHFDTNCDSIHAAKHLYDTAKEDIFSFLKEGSHFDRLSKFGLEYDLEYCCQINRHNRLIKFDGEALRIF